MRNKIEKRIKSATQSKTFLRGGKRSRPIIVPIKKALLHKEQGFEFLEVTGS
jgi:hypothetical protein